MKVSQIYQDYMIPQNLQEHMLRVAALAEILLEHWIGTAVDKNSIIQACLFHDIAKPMTFDLAKQAKFGMLPSDIEKLDKLQKRLKTKYGDEEYLATVKIIKTIGCTPNAVRQAESLDWKHIPMLLENSEIESLILIYCDMRISPKGILPLLARLEELKERTVTEDYEGKVKDGLSLEFLIKQNVDLDVNSITDAQLYNYFDRLFSRDI